MGMHEVNDCRHELRNVAGIAVVVCTTCQASEWWDTDGYVDPTEGVARVFGDYELTGTLPGIGAPAPLVLSYRAPDAKQSERLGAFPLREWVRIHDGLWLSHDGDTLLLAPTDRSVIRTFAG